MHICGVLDGVFLHLTCPVYQEKAPKVVFGVIILVKSQKVYGDRKRYVRRSIKEIKLAKC